MNKHKCGRAIVLSTLINHPTIPQIRFVTLRGVPER